MENFIGHVSKSIKLIISDKINRLTVVMLICTGIICFYEHKNQQAITDNGKAIVKAEKKVDLRYFNLTRSLETLFNVEIETHHGEVVKRHKDS